MKYLFLLDILRDELYIWMSHFFLFDELHYSLTNSLDFQEELSNP